MSIGIKLNEWSEKVAGASFQLVRSPRRGLCLQRKSFNRFYFGGSLTHEVCVPSALAREWINLYDLSLEDFPVTVSF